MKSLNLKRCKMSETFDQFASAIENLNVWNPELDKQAKPMGNLPPSEKAGEYMAHLRRAHFHLRENRNHRKVTCTRVMAHLFKEAMETHKRLPDRSNDRIRPVGSAMPEIAKTKQDCWDIGIERARSDMRPHDGNRLGIVASHADVDRMQDVLELLNFIRSKHWYRLRRLILMRASGSTLIECSAYWQPGRKAFSRQYLSMIMQGAYGEIFTGMETRFSIHRVHNSRNFSLKKPRQ